MKKTKFLTISGIWAMVFRFWQKVFGRRFLAEKLGQDFLDCNWCSYVNVFRFCFKIFLTFSVFEWCSLWLLCGNITSCLLKLQFFLVLRNFSRWLTSKIFNMFRKFWILIEIFRNFDERFPAAFSELHSKCPEEHLEVFFFLWKHQECFVNSEFLVREFEPNPENFLGRIPM